MSASPSDAGNPHAAEMKRGRIALALFAGWFLLLAAIVSGIAPRYFPIIDEWSILANSSWSAGNISGWFTRGFSEYFNDYGDFCQTGTYFLRPFFNFTYGLLGEVLGLGSGSYLYFSAFVVSLSAPLVFLGATAATGNRRGIAIALAIGAPFLPALLGFMPILYAPCLIYDLLAAILCLAAFLAFGARRYLLCTALLVTAIFTKETALPAAAVFPIAYLLMQWRELLARPGKCWVPVLLALPVLLWILARWMAFGAVDNPAYVMMNGATAIGPMLKRALTWPWWLDAHFFSRAALVGGDWALRASLLANLLCMGGIGWSVLHRLRRRQPPELAELVVLSCYLFLVIAGTAGRYGAALQLFLLVAIGRIAVANQRPWLRRGVLAGAFLGLGVTLLGIVQNAPEARASVLRLYDLSRRYVAALREFKPGDHVLVLNDPSTRFARLDWLQQVEHLNLDAVKATEIAWGNWPVLFMPCTSKLEEGSQPRSFVFTQSCGFELGCLTQDPAAIRDIRLNDWATLHVRHQSVSGDHSVPTPWGASFNISLGRGDVHLLYYDAATDQFITRYVP